MAGSARTSTISPTEDFDPGHRHDGKHADDAAGPQSMTKAIGHVKQKQHQRQVLFDPRHRLLAPLGGKRIPGAGCCLLLDEERVVGRLSFGVRYDFR